MARRFWPNSDPLQDRLIVGRGVRPEYDEDPVRQIVGIVGDVRDEGLSRVPRPAMYVPVSQVPVGVTKLNVRLLPIVWIARTSGDPYAFSSLIDRELQQASGGLPVSRIRSMQDVATESTARAQFQMLLMVSFGISALLLAAVGVYGVTAYAVEQRTKELGIRLALGARPGQVGGMVLRQGLLLVLLGIVIGTVTSLGAGRLLAATLFGVTPTDFLTFVLVPLVLTAASVGALLVPAVRGARLTPIVALREE